MRSRSKPLPPVRRRVWCLPSTATVAPAPRLFNSQRDLVVLSLLLRPGRD
jgi:hypothetical protein